LTLREFITWRRIRRTSIPISLPFANCPELIVFFREARLTMPAQKVSGPKGKLLVGNYFEFDRDPLNFILRCSQDYGDIVRLKAFNLEFYLLNHPDLIEEVLVTKNKIFIKDKGLKTRSSRRLFGQGLLTSEGDFWLRQRRLSQPAFHKERIAGYGAVMVRDTTRMINQWKNGEVRDIHADMMRLTLGIVAETLFGTDATANAEVVGSALEIVSEQFSSQGGISQLLDNLFPTPNYLKFEKVVQRLDEIIYQIIDQRRAHTGDRDDLLSMLLKARDDDGSRMSDKQLRDELMTLFLAGHETTALTLSWTWLVLGQHPEVERKLFEEIESVLGERMPAVADLPRLQYTDMVVKESMRLYPPAWMIGREAMEDCEIGECRIPKGAQVLMSQWSMHRNPAYFSDPIRFHPERWQMEESKRLPKYAYFPFGGGPRLCIGNAFAMMEANLILATIAQKCRLELQPNQKITPMPSITLRPKEGVLVTVRKR
jgi:cytochrome P450